MTARTRPGRHPVRAALAVAVLALAACGTPGATGTPAEPEGSMGPGFTLTSTAFAAGAAIPTRFTCDGEDVSPELAWAGVPTGATSLVLVVDDPDARGFVHWIAYDLPAGDGGLAIGASTAATAPRQGTNDFGRVGWGGPCPPSGEHRYRFTLTALAAPLEVSGAPRWNAVRDALARATVLGTAVLEGRYRRRG